MSIKLVVKKTAKSLHEFNLKPGDIYGHDDPSYVAICIGVEEKYVNGLAISGEAFSLLNRYITYLGRKKGIYDTYYLYEVKHE